MSDVEKYMIGGPFKNLYFKWNSRSPVDFNIDGIFDLCISLNEDDKWRSNQDFVIKCAKILPFKAFWQYDCYIIVECQIRAKDGSMRDDWFILSKRMEKNGDGRNAKDVTRFHVTYVTMPMSQFLDDCDFVRQRDICMTRYLSENVAWVNDVTVELDGYEIVATSQIGLLYPNDHLEWPAIRDMVLSCISNTNQLVNSHANKARDKIKKAQQKLEAMDQISQRTSIFGE